MLDALYWIAAAFALVGGCAGNRLAWPLLGSFAFCQIARWRELPFDFNLWLTVDLTVLIGLAIVFANEARKLGWTAFTFRNVAVILLFAPCLVAYRLEPFSGYVLSSLAAIAQLLLIPPYTAIWRRLTLNQHCPKRWNEFDLMVHV